MASYYPPPPGVQPQVATRSRGSSNADRYNPAYQPQNFPPAGSMQSQYAPPVTSSYPPPQQRPAYPGYNTPPTSYGSYGAAYSSSPQATPQFLHPAAAVATGGGSGGRARGTSLPPYPLDRPEDYAPPRRPSYEHKRRDSHSSRYSRDSYHSDGRRKHRSRHSSHGRTRSRSYLDPRRSAYDYDDDDRDQDYDDYHAHERRRRSHGDEVYNKPLRRQNTHRPSWGDTVTSLFSTVKRAIVEPRDKY